MGKVLFVPFNILSSISEYRFEYSSLTVPTDTFTCVITFRFNKQQFIYNLIITIVLKTTGRNYSSDFANLCSIITDKSPIINVLILAKIQVLLCYTING